MRKTALLPLLIIALSACKNPSVSENGAADAQLDSFAVKVKQLNLDPQSQEDVISFFQLCGADFMPNLANDPNKNESYLTNEVLAAANAGVYMADGLYQLAYDQFNEGYMSLQAAKNIMLKLGLGEAFDNLMIDRYSEQNYNVDSLIAMFDSSLAHSQVLLKEQDKARIYTGMICGNYTEKLYLLLSIVFEYNIELPEDAKLLILRQVLLASGEYLKTLPQVIELVQMNSKETDPGVYLDKLKEIEALRQQLKFDAEPGKLTAPMIFENKTLLDIYAKVKETREFIVKVPEI